jgi:hypothetical protein
MMGTEDCPTGSVAHFIKLHFQVVANNLKRMVKICLEVFVLDHQAVNFPSHYLDQLVVFALAMSKFLKAAGVSGKSSSFG